MPVINRLRLNRELDLMQFDVIAEYLQYYKKVTLALSVSPSSVRQNLFFQRVQMALSDIELNGRLIFIISEKEYFGNIKRYNDTLQSYRRMGIKIAVDNLGSNQTSLLYMKDLDIDVVLIDNSFAKHLAEPGYKEIIEGLCSSARALRIKTWIRMIENEEMFNIAKAMKIDYIQGYHIGKFEPFENIYKEE
jgi:EAL domain-containing protein (putative c-di-GMP-specific phosphodiesterase class I)